MTWTAGQCEFTPLLLGLYHVLPSRKVKKRKDVDWVVIEEPEMGLHPQAVAVVMLVVFDLLWRGYKVVISTHSALVLDIIWAVRRLHDHSARWQLLADAFSARNNDPSICKVLDHALAADYRVYFLDIDQKTQRVTTRDISELDPGAESGWAPRGKSL